jgi:hypothetical protein
VIKKNIKYIKIVLTKQLLAYFPVENISIIKGGATLPPYLGNWEYLYIHSLLVLI